MDLYEYIFLYYNNCVCVNIKQGCHYIGTFSFWFFIFNAAHGVVEKQHNNNNKTIKIILV
jgi:hypothetical protein